MPRNLAVISFDLSLVDGKSLALIEGELDGIFADTVAGVLDDALEDALDDALADALEEKSRRSIGFRIGSRGVAGGDSLSSLVACLS